MKTYKNLLFITAIVSLLTACKKEVIEPLKSNEKKITSFVFLANNNTALSDDVTASIDSLTNAITAIVPKGTDVNVLEPAISFSAGATINLTGPQNFSTEISYEVIAEDGTTANSKVRVKEQLASAKQISSFVFLLTNNPIDENIVASIDDLTKTITATMPSGTDLTGLLPTIETPANATVSPITAQDFTNAIEYQVTAEDGSQVVYTATVENALSQRDVLQAIVDANPGNTLNWDLANTQDLGTLSGVSTGFDGKITALNISLRNLTHLPVEIGKLSNLSKLNLNSNSITAIPAEIGNLILLDTLLIFANKLSTLPPEFGNLTNLAYLDLRSNNLSSLPLEIGNLTFLTNLSLSGNNLSSLPSEIGNLIQLKYLNLTKNKLTNFPIEIGKLTNLISLYLEQNKLSTLPVEIGKLTKLIRLSLLSNELNSVPAEIGFLKNLEQLNLGQNNFTTIPQSICNLKEFSIPELIIFFDGDIICETISEKDALISIYSANPGNTLGWGVDNYPGVKFNEAGSPTEIIANNKNLERIPDNIDQLTALASLALLDNELSELPVSLGSISTLQALNFKGNNLFTVPSELGQLSNLIFLSLVDNPIASIPQSVCILQESNGGGGVLNLFTDAGGGCK